ncbi:MAG TPA: hypothetical protein VHE14_05150 [Solirubrobacteraceae bacterium]|nr:hypothetical protein [Solirubrobacteraceae bacterium]
MLGIRQRVRRSPLAGDLAAFGLMLAIGWGTAWALAVSVRRPALFGVAIAIAYPCVWIVLRRLGRPRRGSPGRTIWTSRRSAGYSGLLLALAAFELLR